MTFASLKVWHAKCIPLDETVAIKILDMERMNVQMGTSEKRKRCGKWILGVGGNNA